ncbi:hypothetical protein ES703_71338 [subsurface metagenome]
MMNRSYALARAELIRTLTAYTGITTADGAAGGGTLIDTNLIDNPLVVPAAIPEKSVLIMSGTSAGEDKGAATFNNANGTITLQGAGFNTQILRGTIYRILNISSVEIDVDEINTKLGTNVDAPGTTTVFAYLALLAASGGATLAIVSALLTLTETGGTITATGIGTEDNVYINDAPAGVFEPRLVTIDLSDLGAGETAIVRLYYRIRVGGVARLKDAPVVFAGVQAVPMKDIELEPNRFGLAVTIEATLATVIDWSVHYEV